MTLNRFYTNDSGPLNSSFSKSFIHEKSCYTSLAIIDCNEKMMKSFITFACKLLYRKHFSDTLTYNY